MRKSDWNKIRKAYRTLMPEIFEYNRAGCYNRVDPYVLDWVKYFSPIESIAWGEIRSRGLPMFPQVPVLNYFIDFGDPILKIGVELDGEQYHKSINDYQRDSKLSDYGWTIFRIKGYECYTEKFELEEILEGAKLSEEHEKVTEQKIAKWILESVEGVFFSIDKIFYSKEKRVLYPSCDYYNYCYKSLTNHTNFGLDW